MTISYSTVLGCTDPNYLEYNPNANVDDGSCLTLIVEGCMDPDAENYNPNANVDDGSCDYFCQTGEVEIVLTITQQNNTGAFWSLTANSTNQLASQSGNILLYSGSLAIIVASVQVLLGLVNNKFIGA